MYLLLSTAIVPGDAFDLVNARTDSHAVSEIMRTPAEEDGRLPSALVKALRRN